MTGSYIWTTVRHGDAYIDSLVQGCSISGMLATEILKWCCWLCLFRVAEMWPVCVKILQVLKLMQMHPKERLRRVILKASWPIAINVGQFFPVIYLAYSHIFLKGPSRSIIYGQIFLPPHPHPHIASPASIYHQNQLSLVFRFSFHLTIHFENAGNICNKYDL